jgi:hypothetical protein
VSAADTPLGVKTLRTLAMENPVTEPRLVAASHGTRVAIETMPSSAIAPVSMGAEIVSAANHSAAGLLNVLRELGFGGPWGVEASSAASAAVRG